MAGFTARAGSIAGRSRPGNRVFSEFDWWSATGWKMTGDAYMVVSGVPELRPDHAEALALLALDMREQRKRSRFDPTAARHRTASARPGRGGRRWHQEILYDVWGDTVNVASRMESTGRREDPSLAPSVRAIVGVVRSRLRGESR